MITDPRLFVGRKEELRQIISRMEGAQPISLNIVGERRIGKSSLLYHVFRTWEQRVQRPGRYVVAYLSLQSAAAQTAADFRRAAAQALLEQPAVSGDPDLVRALDHWQEPAAFEQAIQLFQEKHLLPVLCLDEFEELLKYPGEFDDRFYDSLRALTNCSAWMLIIASRRPIGDYRREHRLTSRFFNDAHTIRLVELTEDEAKDLARLPASTVPGAPEALPPEDQRLALQWGGKHPCRLQLAAWALCQARLQGKSVDWARQEFASQEKAQFAAPEERPSLARLGKHLWHFLRLLLWDLPRRLGHLARGTKKAVDDLTNWLLGVLIIAIVILVLLGVLNAQQVLDLLRSLLGR